MQPGQSNTCAVWLLLRRAVFAPAWSERQAVQGTLHEAAGIVHGVPRQSVPGFAQRAKILKVSSTGFLRIIAVFCGVVIVRGLPSGDLA